MKFGRFATHLEYLPIGLLALMSGWPSPALAQDDRAHTTIAQHHEPAPSQKDQAGAFVKTCPGIDRALPGCVGG